MQNNASMTITGISSMATRQLLIELAASYQQQTGIHLKVDSVGGVNASNRILAGEAFDLVFLASDAIEALIKTGHVVAGSKVDLVTSGVAVAVRAGAELPDISSEAQLKATVLTTVSQQKAISYSTGTAVLRWPNCLNDGVSPSKSHHTLYKPLRVCRLAP